MLTKFVAEFTTNHMGNLNVLLRMVEKAAWAGCDYIKMQKKDVETFYSKSKLYSPFDSPYGKTYLDYRTIFEFDKESFDRFDQKCKQIGIPWFVTVQDLPSLEFILQHDLSMLKVASSNARNRDFLTEISRTIRRDTSIVISVAGCTLKEIDESLAIFDGFRIWVLHCVAEYPCPIEATRLGNIKILEDHFASDRISIGYSGHEEGFMPTLAAIDLGAKMIERHFCLSRHSFVHHIECSLEPGEYKQLIDLVRYSCDLKGMYEGLPASAFESHFGMSEIERHFLVNQSYGRKYLGRESKINE